MSAGNTWRLLEKRFSSRKTSERRLIFCAGVFCALVLMYVMLVEPAMLYHSSRAEQVDRERAEATALQRDVAALRERLADPDAAMRRELKEAQAELDDLGIDLQRYDALLVPPGRMPQLLHNLLAKHPGLELVSLKTRAPQAEVAGEARKDSGSRASDRLKAASMYRHEMEITLAGAYPDLLAYAEELQRASPRPLWSAMQLKVVEYPRSELTFVLYTLSLDLPWLAV